MSGGITDTPENSSELSIIVKSSKPSLAMSSVFIESILAIGGNSLGSLSINKSILSPSRIISTTFPKFLTYPFKFKSFASL